MEFLFDMCVYVCAHACACTNVPTHAYVCTNEPRVQMTGGDNQTILASMGLCPAREWLSTDQGTAFLP